jgi:hypothetical protein
MLRVDLHLARFPPLPLCYCRHTQDGPGIRCKEAKVLSTRHVNLLWGRLQTLYKLQRSPFFQNLKKIQFMTRSQRFRRARKFHFSRPSPHTKESSRTGGLTVVVLLYGLIDVSMMAIGLLVSFKVPADVFFSVYARTRTSRVYCRLLETLRNSRLCACVLCV